MKRFVSVLHLLRRNWKTFLGFETLYKLAATALFAPLLFAIFSLTIRSAGLPYLSTESILSYLLHPVTIVCLLLILLLTAFFSLFDMQAVICCCHASHLDRDITIAEMALAGARNAKRVLSPRNWFLIVFVVVLVPLTNTAAVSGLISRIEFPEFIADYIRASTPLRVLQVCISIALMLLALRWCLSLHAFTLEKTGFIAACRKSARLTKRHCLSIAVGTVGVGLLLELLLLILGCVFIGIVFLGIHFLCPADLQCPIASYTLLATGTVGSYLSMVFTVPVAFAYLSVRYYAYCPDAAKDTDIVNREPARCGKTVSRIVCAVLCAVILLSAALQAHWPSILPGYAAEALLPPEIAAHRGSSKTAPENSMPAFRQAIEDGADWIELDVHQTKDGVIVVTHDESIKRIAGVQKNVWELTYDELAQYDAGSWFSPEYADLRIATLNEVLRLCKGKIKLNIELKPTGHEPDFEQHVLDCIHENGYEEGEYILASLNANTLVTLKRLEPDVKTLYIMTIAIGNVKDIPFADAFSIEESSITERLVKSIHDADKQLYVWTVNRSDNVDRMVGLDVDCIISDDPVMVKTALLAAPLSDDLQSLVEIIFPESEPQTIEEEEQAI